MTSFSSEQLNFFKFSTIVIDEFPVALRKVFVSMWDTLIAPRHGCPQWDNSAAVLNLFLNNEGGVKKVPFVNKYYELWDCTALFKATLFAQTFARDDGSGKWATLHTLYVKPHGLLSGAFHTPVISLVGNQPERFALALDQFRLLRNTLCHQSSTQKIDKATFDHYVLLAKDAFAALSQDSAKIDDIGRLGEDDFPTARVQQLEDELMKEKETAIKFKQIEYHLVAKMEEVNSNVKEVMTDVKDLKQASDLKQAKEEAESLKVQIKPGIPRDKELDELAGKIAEPVWYRLGTHLGIDDDKLKEIEKTAMDPPYQMLRHWKTTKTSEATYRVLYEALCEGRVGRRDLAKTFCCQ